TLPLARHTASLVESVPQAHPIWRACDSVPFPTLVFVTLFAHIPATEHQTGQTHASYQSLTRATRISRAYLAAPSQHGTYRSPATPMVQAQRGRTVSASFDYV
ncbi:hypothetical protein BV898_19750, partial [Hypsibius exemplaris]